MRTASTEPASLHCDQPLHGLLADTARRRPDAVSLLFDEDRYTFRDLHDQSSALANALTERGIGHGDRVVLYLSNRPEWVVALFAISKLGAAAVLISSAWKAAEVRHALSLTQPSAAIADGEGVGVIDQLGRPRVAVSPDPDLPTGWDSFRDLVSSASTASEMFLGGDFAELEVALPFSSGTTGLPKAVRHSHRTLMAGIVQWQQILDLRETDVLQAYTPLAHILGVVNIGGAIASGATIRLFRRFAVEPVLESIEADGVTVGVAVSPIAAALANAPDLERHDLGSLRYFMWCATPLAVPVANRFTQRTGVRWLQAYGATESICLFANPVMRPDEWRLDSPGLPTSGVEAMVIDPETHEQLESGQPGELVVQNPSTMLGYLPEEANTDVFLEGGWFRTGDIGWLEPRGWLHLTARLKEMIRVSALQVSPQEVESMLLEHEGIADCAVFGVPDDDRGELPHAVIVLLPGSMVEPGDIQAWAASRLASYKRLAAVHVVGEIPRTASGKTLRRALSEQHARPHSS